MKNIIKMPVPVSIVQSASVVGKKEHEGPLGQYFDMHEDDIYFGQDSWEKAESEMCRRTLSSLLAKAHIGYSELDLVLAGDLLNQCIGSSFGLLDCNTPFIGLYGACSTFAEGLIIGSNLCSTGQINRCVALASSHFCSSERQYRFPIEYGGQRAPTTQNTVTGCGAYLLECTDNPPYITECVIGRIIDSGVKDQNNMGAAMAPAAVDTIMRYFNESGKSANEFDIIATGDLAKEGYELTCELLQKCKIDMCGKYTDCGILMYDYEKQDVHSGASGCGCSACISASYFMDRLKNGVNDILLIGTGALLSPLSVLQGQNILGIAHLVHISNKRN